MAPFDPTCMPFRGTLAGVVPDGILSALGDTSDLATSDDVPLAPFFTKTVCEGDHCDKVLIQGHLSSRILNVIPTIPASNLPAGDWPDTVPSSAMPVKMRVQRCKYPGWVYVDADRSLVVDGGEEVTVQLMAPSGLSAFPWVLVPGSASPVELPADFQYVEWRLRACVLRTCCPRSQLTMYGAVAQGDRIIRPRRAVRLQILGASTWHWESLGGGFLGGSFTVGAAVSQPIDVGALEVLVADNAANPVTLVWEIE